MRAGRCAAPFLAALLLCAVAAAQVAPEEPEPPRKTPIPTEGFWPTKTLLKRAIERMSEAIGDEYDMDEDQRARTTELLQKRFTTFLDDNRGELQTLLNQFLEAQFHDEPPTPEEMAEWSTRVIPMLKKMEGTFGEVSESMKEYLTDEQTMKLETEYIAFETGLKLVYGKLGDWTAGRFDPKTEWFSPGTERARARERQAEAMDREMEAARAAHLEGQDAPLTEPADDSSARRAERRKTVARSTDEWTRYVDDFVRRYELNDEQRQKAETFLRSKQVERDSYLQRKSADVEKITKQGRDASNDEEKQAAKAASDKLYAPVERMFQQLKDKLETLPTRAQRQKAGAASQPAAAQAAPETQPQP